MKEDEKGEKPPTQIGDSWEEDTEERWRQYVERREKELRDDKSERERRIQKA